MSLPTCACGHEYFRHGDSARLWLNLGVGAGKCKECDCKKWASPKNATANSMSLPPPRSSTPSGSPSESQSGSQSSTPSENQNSSRPDKPFVGFRGWRIDPRGLLPVVHYEKGPWALREPTRATVNAAFGQCGILRAFPTTDPCLVTEKHHAAEPSPYGITYGALVSA